MRVYPESSTGGKDFWRYVSLSDFTDIWTKILLLSLKDKDLNASEVFVRLMSLGVALEWRGSHREKPFFIPNPALGRMREQIPSLKVKQTLADDLNKDAKLLEKTRTVKPSGIKVMLTGFTRSVSPRNLLKEENLQIFLKYIQDPNVFIWDIYIQGALSEPMNEVVYREKIKEGNDLLNRIAEVVIDVTRREVLDMYRKLPAEKPPQP